MTTPERAALAELAAESGAAVPCSGNLPLDLGDPRFVWFIGEGAIDLFLVEHRNGVEQSARQHLLRADAGRLLPGVAPQVEGTTLGLIAKGLPGTVLRRLPVAALAAITHAELAEQVDAWLTDVSTVLSRDVAHQPRADERVEPAESSVSSGARCRRGGEWCGSRFRRPERACSWVWSARRRPAREKPA